MLAVDRGGLQQQHEAGELPENGEQRRRPGHGDLQTDLYRSDCIMRERQRAPLVMCTYIRMPIDTNALQGPSWCARKAIQVGRSVI